MLIYSMSVSVDGFTADCEGAFGWTPPAPWETDLAMPDNELGAAFADVWCAIPKVVFSRTLDSVQQRPACRGVTGR